MWPQATQMGKNLSTNTLKIINDPVYGFIKIPFDLVFELIEHPLFQRLRRIRQLGLTHFVYPGANHSRFQHAIGAMHLMGLAIEEAKLTMIPNTTLEVDANVARQVMRAMEMLEENDDVQDVYSNFDMSEEAMAAVMAE